MTTVGELFPQSGGGATSVDLVASGAITAGDPVAVNSDDTVSCVSNTEVVTNAGTQYEFASGALSNHLDMVWHETLGVAVIFYVEASVTKAVVATVTGTVVAFGTPTTVTSEAVIYMQAHYEPTTDEIYIVYKRTAAHEIYTHVCTVSGTTVTVNTRDLVASNNAYCDITYHVEQQRVVVAYGSTTSASIILIAGEVSAGRITYGTPLTANSGTINGQSICYDPMLNCIVSIISTGGSANTLLMHRLLDTSFTLYGQNGSTALNQGAMNFPTIVYSKKRGKYVMCGVSGSTNYLTLFSLDGEGRVAKSGFFGASTNGSSTNRVTFAIDESTSMAVILDGNTATNSIDAYYFDGLYSVSVNVAAEENALYGSPTAAGTDNTITYETGSVAYRAAVHIPGRSGTFLIAHSDGNDSTKGKCIVVSFKCSHTNAEEYIGIASATVTDGETVTVIVDGVAETNANNLLVGSDYWVTKEGAFSAAPTSTGNPIGALGYRTTNQRFPKVGRAITKSKMLLKTEKQYINYKQGLYYESM